MGFDGLGVSECLGLRLLAGCRLITRVLGRPELARTLQALAVLQIVSAETMQSMIPPSLNMRSTVSFEAARNR